MGQERDQVVQNVDKTLSLKHKYFHCFFIFGTSGWQVIFSFLSKKTFFPLSLLASAPLSPAWDSGLKHCHYYDIEAEDIVNVTYRIIKHRHKFLPSMFLMILLMAC
jgi:hypothetical protein